MNGSYGKKVQKLRVPVGFLLAVVYIALSRPTYSMLLAGSAVAFAGVLLRLWAAGHIEKGKRLATSGPYALTRNPLYLGSLVIGIGFAMASCRWLIVFMFALYFFLFYIPVIRQEEQELRAAYPAEFENYARHVPFLIPRLLRAPAVEARQDGGPAKRFDPWLVMKNREYNSIFGFICVVVMIYLKILFSF